MGLFKKLSKLVGAKVDLSRLKASDISLVKNITGNKLFDYKDNRIIINISHEKADKHEIRQLIRDELKNHGTPILAVSASKTVDSISSVNLQDDELVKFFDGKISDENLDILKSALYIRHVYAQGKSVVRLKESLVERYGEKARNIANLCSAGYFESFMRPLYDELSKLPDFTSSQFVKGFDLIVTTAPFTVFVHRSMTQADVHDKIKVKLQETKRYGLPNLNIHGIGYENIHKIYKVLDEKDIKELLPEGGPDITKTGLTIHVKIRLQSHPATLA